MTALPASGYLSDAARTQQQMKDAFEDLRDFVAEGVGGSAVSALTIASGVITPTAARHMVDTEAAASSDVLTNISLDLPDGRWLVLEHADASRLVIVEHLAGGDGQIELIAGYDIVLQNRSRLILERSGARWRQVVETQIPGGATGTSDDFWGDEDDIPARSVLMFGQTLDAAVNPELAARCPDLVDGSDINVPDVRERVVVGKNSASSPSSRIDSGYLDTSAVGNTGGADDVTLSAAQTPVVSHFHGPGALSAANHLHFVTSAVGIAGNTHNHLVQNVMLNASGGGIASGSNRTQGGNTGTQNDTHGHAASFAANTAVSGALAVSGNSAAASAAASAAVGLLQPSIVANKILWL